MIVLPHSQIRVLAPVEDLDYIDSQSIGMSQPRTALEIWNMAARRPLPGMKLAFRLRDRVAGWFGATPIGGFSGTPVDAVNVGDQLDFFQVDHVEDDVLALSVRDTHLDVMICVSTVDRLATMTASVVVHNRFGHLYMLPVGLVHRWIVHATLKRLT